MSCGLYERTTREGKTVRLVWRDEKPLPRFTRVSDAECGTQVDIRTGEVVDLRREPQERAKARAIDWIRAEDSLMRQGPVSLPVFQERMRQCMDCPRRAADPEGGAGWCNSCGCGQRERARLETKLTMPAVSCPLGKWGESKGSWGGFRRAVVGGLMQTRAIVAATFMDLSRWIKPRPQALKPQPDRA